MTRGPESGARAAWRRFERHRLAVAGALLLAFLYSLTLVGGFLAPYEYRAYDRARAWHPPTKVRFFDADGKFAFRPFFYATRAETDPETLERRFVEDESAPVPLELFVRGDAYEILFFFETDVHLFGTRPDAPMRFHLFGTDRSGRDVFSRLVHGSRISLSIGIVAVLLTLAIGLALGSISGYCGGKVDLLVQRLCEMVLMLPAFYLLISLSGAIPAEWPPEATYFAIVLILSFVGWGGFARVVRGIVLSVRERDYVASARALGARPLSTLVRHVLPATVSYVIVSATLRIPGAILAESALSALNLGVREPAASWGNMLADATVNVLDVKRHPWTLVPGAAIFLTVLAFNWLGDGLRDALDPKET